MTIVQNHIRALLPIVIKTTVNQTQSQWYNDILEKQTQTHTQYKIAGQSQMVPVDLLRVSSIDENNSARFFAP